MLDNPRSIMVKYFKLNTAVNGKSNQFCASESLGHWLGAPDRGGLVNVRPGAGAFPQ